MVFKVGDRVKCVRIIADSEEVLGMEGVVDQVGDCVYGSNVKNGTKLHIVFGKRISWNVGSAALELLSTLTNEEVFWRNVEGNN